MRATKDGGIRFAMCLDRAAESFDDLLHMIKA